MTQQGKTSHDEATRAGPTDDGRELESKRAVDTAAPLPHETDESPASQDDREPRKVGEQAHEDLERGLEDTDRRGGADYQERTQTDEHANTNSPRKP
ncbi:MAG: hypothetical protein M3O74_23580 [Pseudomonadota bacterium]|jgi:hypothetical protein|uniref:Uncharacterized protein n=1 Tax=Caballeronia sordidicola TaxID=196367 RepID=A0A242MC13_CABSO|nr:MULTISPECIES: hypothetical protein [Burkholderiaceae]AME24808.1 hypothetical protein AXG89_14035 [Burkholderia sp. PAMC 26561]AMM14040.1 hypothetical protein AX768_07910 [Burkholderia sp. PAMC 28687]MDP9157223.1 hypothetical protein [Pseudomonadota bacterium]OTP68825.1 hypothetical protein PAMC26510_28265 [Caballeronia sordidicola]